MHHQKRGLFFTVMTCMGLLACETSQEHKSTTPEPSKLPARTTSGAGLLTAGWSPTGSMAEARHGHTATVLPSGKVLVAGGSNQSARALASAELYDPTTGTWSSTGNMLTTRDGHAATLLSSGKVLLVGGGTVNGTFNYTAELYNPDTGTWSAAASPRQLATQPTLTLLPSGKVLFLGDSYCRGTAELYDPVTDTWTTQDPEPTPRKNHTALLLPSGKVMLAGGSCTTDAAFSVDLYDPTTGTFSVTGSLAERHDLFVLLSSGKVLAPGAYTTPSELYDPTTETWSKVESMASDHDSGTATLLPSGKVFIAGGSTAETFDPVRGRWGGRPMARPRQGHTTTLLPSGLLLLVGGYVEEGLDTVYLSTADLLEPANTAPVAVNSGGVHSTSEDSEVSVGMNATDNEGDPLDYVVVQEPSHGTLSADTGRIRTYTPNENFHGTDSFTFKVNDGTEDSNIATVMLSVTPVNDGPVALDQSVMTNEDTPASLTLAASDIDGDTLRYIVEAPAHGKLTGTAPNLTYTPDTNYSGSDSFVWRIYDASFLSSQGTVSIVVKPENDAPVAQAQSWTTTERSAISVMLTATDAEGEALTYQVVSGPAHGALSGTAPELTYTPNEGFSGTDSFTFKVSDGSLDSQEASVSISVKKVQTPEPPVSQPSPPVSQPSPSGAGFGCSGAPGGAWPFWGLLLLVGIGRASRRVRYSAPA